MSKEEDSFVSFRSVKKSFDGKTLIIKDLNLNINKGEFVTLLGPSGSGKTTCLMMLAGFESVTDGEILIAGKSIQNIAPSKRNLGMVFQDYSLFPHMTVKENLAFPLEIRKNSKEEINKSVNDALDMVSLSGYESRRIGQLSGGQKQRVAVARALIFRPEIILMDEPLGALDKNLREEMQFEIMHLHNSLGITFIYVTHDQSEAVTMSDRIAVFDNGEIQQYDTPARIWEKPQNTFVASFIGENNCLNGTIESISKEQSRTSTQKGPRICSASLADGTTIKAQAVNVFNKGETSTLTVRPERVLIGKEATAATGSNYSKVSGQILEAIYMGDHIRIRIRVADSDAFIIKVENTSEHPSYERGEKLNLAWRAEDCHALGAA